MGNVIRPAQFQPVYKPLTARVSDFVGTCLTSWNNPKAEILDLRKIEEQKLRRSHDIQDLLAEYYTKVFELQAKYNKGDIKAMDRAWQETVAFAVRIDEVYE